MHFNLSYIRVEVPSDTLVYSSVLLSYAILMLSLALYILTVWAILKRSPPLMGAYRWYLLFNISAATSYEVVYTLIGSVTLLPYPVLLYEGWPLRVFAPMDPVLLYAIQMFWAMSISLIGCSIGTLFLYRYCQLRENWFYTHVLQNAPLTIGLNILLAIAIVSVTNPLPGLSYAAIADRSRELREAVRLVDGELYVRIKEKNILEYTVG